MRISDWSSDVCSSDLGNRRATGIRFRSASNDDAVSEKLGQIRAPTLILWGDKDGLIPVANASEFRKRISGAEVVIYANVGHIPMEEVPEKSAADVDGFLTVALASPAPLEPAPMHHDGKVEILPVSPE